MAFTKEEVEQALLKKPDLDWRYPVVSDTFLQSPFYNQLMDYLTGKSSSLPGIQITYDEYPSILIMLGLLKDIENPSVNDQLILHALSLPGFDQLRYYPYSMWLLEYSLSHTGNNAVRAIRNQFGMLRMNDDDIFNFLILAIDDDTPGSIYIKKTAAHEFVTEHIRKSRGLIFPTRSLYHSREKWSKYYFTLLEELRPEFSTSYALSVVSAEDNTPILFLADYRNGQYLPALLDFLKVPEHNLEMSQLKLSAALKLYEKDEVKFGELAAGLSQQYLEYYGVHHSRNRWESGFRFQAFANTNLKDISYSACALHILLKHDRARGLGILNEQLVKKNNIHIDALQVIQFHLGADAFPYIEKALVEGNATVDFIRQLIARLQEDFDPAQYLPVLWRMTSHKSKPVKELVAKVLAEMDPEAETKAISLLRNKSADIRQTAAFLLAHFTSAEAVTAIINVLDKETNDVSRDVFLQMVIDTLPRHATTDFIDNIVNAAKERGKLKKPLEAWLEESSLPAIYDHSGRVLSNDYTRFLFYRMSRVKGMHSDIEARYIILITDREKAAPFSLELLKLFNEKGGKPEHKYLMALAALLGNDTLVDKIRMTIDHWIEGGRYKMAEQGVGALALQGSDRALRWVEWYSRKYKTKKANVGAAALLALETAAMESGISIHELGDRVVPDFGFGGLFKHFSIGEEEYRAFIDSNFKMAFFNENNKKLKALPASAGAEIKEEFKHITKEVREVVRSQSSRLEYYLIIQRRWEYDQWQKFFLQNPVMFIYATKILWGAYDGEGRLLQTFLCNEDTELQDISGNEISIESDYTIGIVHPSQLNPALLQDWTKQFFELSIEPIFPQLERKMPDLKDIDLSKSILTKFQGRSMMTGSIKSTLERRGWHKGPTGDGGMIDSFHLSNSEENIEAILEVEGVGAGFGWGAEEKTGRLYVIKKSGPVQKWFNPPQHENAEGLVSLEKVPAIFLNEMLSAVELIKQKNPTD